ncbi:MAG: SRPBCC domain-containing protein [Chloroflexi bacterium]|nr:SRPBCC domain-containing protein [Chloroflexota bacterium]
MRKPAPSPTTSSGRSTCAGPSSAAGGPFHWEDHGDFPIRVEAVEEPRYLAWRWGLEIQPGPDVRESPTLVEWLLEPTDDGGTLLRLRESGFVFESHRTENDAGWAEELGKLVFLIEGGQ